MNFSGCFFFLLLATISYQYPSHTCPQGQFLAHDGECIEPFRLKITPNKNTRNLFDTASGCPDGEERAHDGLCTEPFRLNITGLAVPNVTVTTIPSVMNFKSSSEIHLNGHQDKDRSTRTTRRLGYTILTKSSTNVAVRT